ncbi:MAG: flagellar biosynthesis regulator FlaF [Hyphomicrobiaceae bacterium]
MPQHLYAELLQDDQSAARSRERSALDQSIALMEQVARGQASASESVTAITYTSRLWTLLLQDLASPDNALSRELKGQIVSVGIWILRELERFRSGTVHSFDDIIDVTKVIRDGLQ